MTETDVRHCGCGCGQAAKARGRFAADACRLRHFRAEQDKNERAAAGLAAALVHAAELGLGEAGIADLTARLQVAATDVAMLGLVVQQRAAALDEQGVQDRVASLTLELRTRAESAERRAQALVCQAEGAEARASASESEAAQAHEDAARLAEVVENLREELQRAVQERSDEQARHHDCRRLLEATGVAHAALAASLDAERARSAELEVALERLPGGYASPVRVSGT